MQKKHRDKSSKIIEVIIMKIIKRTLFLHLILLMFTKSLYADSPSNEELFKIIQDLQKNQEILLKELSSSKKELEINNTKLLQTEKALKAQSQNNNSSKQKVLISDKSGFTENEYLIVAPSFNRYESNFTDYASARTSTTTNGTKSNAVESDEYFPGLNIVYGKNNSDGSGYKIKFDGYNTSTKESIKDISEGGTSFLYPSNFAHNQSFNIRKSTNIDSAEQKFKHTLMDLEFLKTKKVNISELAKFDLDYGIKTKYSKEESKSSYVKDSRTLFVDSKDEIFGIGPSLALGSDIEFNSHAYRFKLLASLLAGNHEARYFSIESDSTTNFFDERDKKIRAIPTLGFEFGLTNNLMNGDDAGLYYDLTYSYENIFSGAKRFQYVDDTQPNQYVISESDVFLDSLNLKLGYIF